MAFQRPRRFEPAQRRTLLPLAWLGVLGMWLAICASISRGAELETLPYDDAFKAKRTEVEGILRAGQIPGGKQELFDDFFTKYALPQFMNNSMAPNANLRNVLKDFRKYFPFASGPPRQRLLELTVDGLDTFLFDPALQKKFLRDPRWTIAKMNAIALLGDLNDTEKAGPGTRAKPLPTALVTLLKVVKPPAKVATPTGEEGRDDSLRAAALVALRHQAEFPDAPAETRTKLRDAMLLILKQQQPLPGHDAEVNDYLRARAAEVLALMKDVGPKNSVVRAFDGIIANPAEAIGLRCETARALGGLEFPPGSSVDFKPLANHIGQLAVDACKQELDPSKEPTIDTGPQRRLKALVHDALEGMIGESGRSGLLAGTTEPTQLGFVKKITEKLRKLDATLDGEKDKGTLAAAKVTAAMSDLESALEPRGEAPKLPAARAPAGDAEVLAGSAPK